MKADMIRRALSHNYSVRIVSESRSVSFPDSRNPLVYTNNFIVAPARPIYEASKLNEFMKGLVPELKPRFVLQFVDRGPHMELGKLCFDEIDPPVNRIMVHLFPDQELAMTARQHLYEIGNIELARFEKRDRTAGFVGAIG